MPVKPPIKKKPIKGSKTKSKKPQTSSQNPITISSSSSEDEEGEDAYPAKATNRKRAPSLPSNPYKQDMIVTPTPTPPPRSRQASALRHQNETLENSEPQLSRLVNPAQRQQDERGNSKNNDKIMPPPLKRNINNTHYEGSASEDARSMSNSTAASTLKKLPDAKRNQQQMGESKTRKRAGDQRNATAIISMEHQIQQLRHDVQEKAAQIRQFERVSSELIESNERLRHTRGKVDGAWGEMVGMVRGSMEMVENCKQLEAARSAKIEREQRVLEEKIRALEMQKHDSDSEATEQLKALLEKVRILEMQKEANDLETGREIAALKEKLKVLEWERDQALKEKKRLEQLVAAMGGG